jgi:hypothetical protein
MSNPTRREGVLWIGVFEKIDWGMIEQTNGSISLAYEHIWKFVPWSLVGRYRTVELDRHVIPVRDSL